MMVLDIIRWFHVCPNEVFMMMCVLYYIKKTSFLSFIFHYALGRISMENCTFIFQFRDNSVT